MILDAYHVPRLKKIKKLRNNNWESIIKLAHLKKCFSFYFQKSLKISKTAIVPPPPLIIFVSFSIYPRLNSLCCHFIVWYY